MNPKTQTLDPINGQTLLEVLISLTLISITMILILGGIALIPRRQTQTLNASHATLLAQEATEIFFYLATNDWNNFPANSYIPAINGNGEWTATIDTGGGENINVGKTIFNRQVKIEDLYRDLSDPNQPITVCNPATNPNCKQDQYLRRITSIVTWPEPGTAAKTITPRACPTLKAVLTFVLKNKRSITITSGAYFSINS